MASERQDGMGHAIASVRYAAGTSGWTGKPHFPTTHGRVNPLLVRNGYLEPS
jgi:hypothetical protein